MEEREPRVKVREENRRAGLAYAVTDEGIELPVIDITHPAFALDVGQDELRAQAEQYRRETEQQARVPAFVRKLILRVVLRRSVLARGIQAASGTFLDGLSTYLLKLGPDNLGRYAAPVDRKIAASLPALAARLRLQEVARLLAEGMAPALAARPGRPCHLLAIGGGPAIDALNALLLLRKEHPARLAGRALVVHVLDIEEAGPAFGARALRALGAEGGALGGLGVELRAVRYDWSDAGPLRALLAAIGTEGAVVAGSSEGALFEYGTDEAIEENLVAFREGSPADAVLVGSVTRADGAARAMNDATKITVKPRGIEGFLPLAARAGWALDRQLDGPLSHQVRLVKR